MWKLLSSLAWRMARDFSSRSGPISVKDEQLMAKQLTAALMDRQALGTAFIPNVAHCLIMPWMGQLILIVCAAHPSVNIGSQIVTNISSLLLYFGSLRLGRIMWRVQRNWGRNEHVSKRMQVSILAPTMYPLTSKLILMNFPCKRKQTGQFR